MIEFLLNNLWYCQSINNKSVKKTDHKINNWEYELR